MAKLTFRFDPDELHRLIWEQLKDLSYTLYLDTSQPSRSAISCGLFGCVIHELFLSVPEQEMNTFDAFLAEYISDVPGLQNALAAVGEVEQCTPKHGVVSVQDHLNNTKGSTIREYMETLPRKHLANLAYSKVYEVVRSHIERHLIGMYQQVGKSFNPYAVVTIDAVFHHNRRIISLDLVVENDVRDIFYKEHFPTGRFKANC